MIRRKKSFEFAISVLIFLLVFVFVWQIKGVKRNTEIKSLEELTKAEMEKVYLDERDKNEILLKKIETLQGENASQAETIEAFRSTMAEEDGYADVLNDKLSSVELFAGLTNVKGKGVIITLNDAKLTDDMKGSGQYTNYGIVHDVNISRFVNELKAAGAEAISVNGQRIVNTSEIRCVGPSIMVNSEKVAAPFVIKAIGDASALESALKINGGVVDEATTLYRIEVTIQKDDNVEINRFVGSTQMKYASTVTAEEAKQ